MQTSTRPRGVYLPNLSGFGFGRDARPHVLSRPGPRDIGDILIVWCVPNEVDVVKAQQPGFGGTQAAGVDRAEQNRHDQVPERDLRVVVTAVGLGEEGRQFLVGVDVRDVAGGPGQLPALAETARHAPAAQPAISRTGAARPCRVAGLTPRCRAAAIQASTEARVGVCSPGNWLAENAANRAGTCSSASYL
jgi:hypothetical protein